MRVAITGAQGVGKSTLASQLCSALALRELPTPGRTLAARGLPINEQATVSSQLVAWLLQYRLERETSDWVASRSLVDVWAYTALAAARQQLDAVEEALIDELERATPLAIAGSYDELIYVPPRIALVADDVRPDDEGFQRTTDELIQQALARWGIARRTVDVSDADAVQALVRQLTERAAGSR